MSSSPTTGSLGRRIPILWEKAAVDVATREMTLTLRLRRCPILRGHGPDGGVTTGPLLQTDGVPSLSAVY